MHTIRVKVLAAVFFAMLLASGYTNGQGFPFWGGLERGPFGVGYRDTVLFNKTSTFTYYEYTGAKPFFISIWYPSKGTNQSSPYMKFSDYMNFGGDEATVSRILDTLRKKYSSIYVEDGIKKSIKGLKPVSVELEKPRQKVFSDIQNSRVYAKRKLPTLEHDFPVIYYHHGAQSTPFDNFVFCEYMASHGYIVISSNFLWPLEQKESLGGANQVEDLLFVVTATSAMADRAPYLIAVGHSWGAQVLLLADTLKEKPFKKIIALHTTLEDKPVDRALKMWPSLAQALQEKHSLMTTPTVILAPEFRIKDGFDFLPFRENMTTPYTLITVKTKFITHDGFIALGNLRAPFSRKLEDSLELRMQQSFYEEILRLSHHIIASPEKVNPYLEQNFDIKTAN